MITYDDAAKILALAAARDQRTVGEADLLAWQADLSAAGVTRTDAEAALVEFYARHTPSLEPRDRYRATTPDIIAIAKRLRRERLANFRYEPPAIDTESPRQYLARLRGQIAAVADGRATAQQRPALPAGAGNALPGEVGQILRRVPNEDQQASPLSVRCPACGALVGRHCKGGRKGVRLAAHGARKRAASGQPTETPDEIQRRRAASAAYLANHPQETAS